MYSGDTFFHLTLAGQIGLVICSAVMALLTIWMFTKVSSRFGVLVKVILAIIFLWAFVWLSPQLHYVYYMQLFDGLPLQNVVQTPPHPSEIFRLATFSANANLSDHSKGILFWLMIVIGLWKSYSRRP